MKELGITKGKCFYENEVIRTLNTTICRVYQTLKKPYEAKKNKVLILDAFNTAQKTGLLPSELLQRYNEAIEVLEQLYNSCAPTNVELRNGKPRWGSCGVPSDESIYNAKQTISKAKGE